MIQVTPKHHIYVGIDAIDFRKGIDGLCGICKYEIKKDPMSGGMFAFSNRSRKALKILVYDSQGFWVFDKRLSRGSFHWWPQSSNLCLKINFSPVVNIVRCAKWLTDTAGQALTV